jgi:L-lactate utilization protein LutC
VPAGWLATTGGVMLAASNAGIATSGVSMLGAATPGTSVITGASAACIALVNDSANAPNVKPTRRAARAARLSLPLFVCLFCISPAGY